MIIRLSESTWINLESIEYLHIYVNSSQISDTDCRITLEVDFKLKDCKIQTARMAECRKNYIVMQSLKSSVCRFLRVRMMFKEERVLDLFNYCEGVSTKDLIEKFERSIK